MKPVISLNGFELGQLMALLPDVAWNRMVARLRKKLKAALDELTNSEEELAELNLKEPPLASE